MVDFGSGTGETPDAVSLPRSSPDAIAIGRAQLVLAEKRTALAVMRTGIAVFAIPMGVLSLLLATSRYYSPSEALHLFIPLLMLCALLVLLGGYLVVRSILRIRSQDEQLRLIRKQNPAISGALPDGS